MELEELVMERSDHILSLAVTVCVCVLMAMCVAEELYMCTFCTN